MYFCGVAQLFSMGDVKPPDVEKGLLEIFVGDLEAGGGGESCMCHCGIHEMVLSRVAGSSDLCYADVGGLESLFSGLWIKEHKKNRYDIPDHQSKFLCMPLGQ